MDIATLGIAVDSSSVPHATKRLGRMTRAAGRTERGTKSLTASMSRMAGVAGAALAAAFSVGAMMSFQTGLAEVSTLVNTATFGMASLTEAALDQGRQFGNIQGQVGAYYSIISAGASDVAGATDILTAANKLAVGGVTDIGTAADGLTSVLNAYGDQVESATSVSDALFVGMRTGKTTIAELSAGIGGVAPLAAQLGVEFDELVGSVSALTKGGISTNQAFTGVKAVLASVAKPTVEASEMAKLLGIEFTSAGLSAKGFQGFIEDLVEKTHGSTDALAQLFGGVEALVPILALSGQAGADFSRIMHDMAIKAGMSDEAFEKMANTVKYQLGLIVSGFKAEALEMTGTWAEALVPKLKFVVKHMDLVIKAVKVATVVFAALVAPALVGGVYALAGAIGALAIAAGPLGLAFGLAAAGIAVFALNYEKLKGIMDGPIVTEFGSGGLLEEAQRMGAPIADLIREMDKKNEGRGSGAAGKVLAFDTNSILAQFREIEEAKQELSSFALPSLDDGTANPYQSLIASVNQRIGQMEVEQEALGLTEAAANKLRYTTEFLNQAANENIKLSPEQRSELEGLAGQLAETEAQTNLLADAFNFTKSTVSGFLTELRSGLRNGESFWESFGNAATSVLDKIANKLQDTFVDQLFSGGSQGGGGDILSAIFGTLFGGGNLVATSNFGGTPTNLMGSLKPFSAGGYTGDSPTDAIAGVVHGGEYVFSAGATSKLGIGFLEGLHNGAKGYADGGYVGPAMPRFANSNAPKMQVTINNQASDKVAVSIEERNGELIATIREVSAQTYNEIHSASAQGRHQEISDVAINALQTAQYNRVIG